MDHHFFSFRNCKSQCKTQNKKINCSGITNRKYSKTGGRNSERKSDRESEKEREGRRERGKEGEEGRHSYGPWQFNINNLYLTPAHFRQSYRALNLAAEEQHP